MDELEEPEDEEYGVIEGEIEKFKLGLRGQYIKRWCVLTNKSLKCYTSQWTKEPLFTLNYTQIENIEKAASPTKKRKGRASVVASLDTATVDERCFIVEVSDWFLENVLFKKDRVGRSSTAHATAGAQLTGSGDKFGRKSTEGAEGGKTGGDGRSSTSNLQEKLRDAVQAKVDGKTVGQQAIERNFIKALEEKKRGREEPQQVLGNAAMKSLNTKSAWTNREEEWKLSEKHMTFRCSSSEECDAWIGLITQFLNEEEH